MQALPKGDRGELAVEVLTEIGVDRDRAVGGVALRRGLEGRAGDEVADAKWRSTAREAAKQARRSWFPEVTAAGLHRRRRRPASRRPTSRVVLHEEATDAARRAGRARQRAGSCVVVGPEGGITDDEVAAFVAAGAHAVRLGAEVLRTSTAGVAAVAALLARTPRWS